LATIHRENIELKPFAPYKVKHHMELIELPKNILDQILGAKVDNEDDDEDGIELSKSEAEEIELDRLPRNAILVWQFDDEVFHSPGLTWQLSCTYFAVPVQGQANTFALLALNWDDNYGQWDWRLDGGVSGAAAIDVATKFFKKLCKDRHAGSE
jgi:hypothetical protein